MLTELGICYGLGCYSLRGRKTTIYFILLSNNEFTVSNIEISTRYQLTLINKL